MKRCNRFTRSEGHLLLFLGAVLMFTLSTNPLGAQGSALQFNGAQIVSAPIDSTRLNLNFTIEGWAKWNNPAIADTEVILYIGNTGLRGYGLYIDNSTGHLMVLVGGVFPYDSGDSLKNGELTHIALSYNGNWFIHVNGISAFVGDAGMNPLLPIDTLLIGACQLNTEGFHGIVDEVRISDTVRYAMGTDFTPPMSPFILDSNTIALYHFDEGSGNTTADAAHGYTGYFGAPPHNPSWVESPLPIQLAFLTATIVAGTEVRIEWTTVSETNNYGFYVERRPQSGTTFTSVSGLIPGAGTSLKTHHYSWIDSTVATGTYVYRLKQVDLTGHFVYSPEITVASVLGVDATKLLPKEFALQQNYPNPFNPTTVISYQLPVAGYVTLKVYDMLGREVVTLVNGAQDAGYKSVEFSAANLPSGIYTYRLTAGTFVEVKKMLMLK